jgi:hypothetical protein
MSVPEKFEDTKEVIRSRKPEKVGQYNDQQMTKPMIYSALHRN